MNSIREIPFCIVPPACHVTQASYGYGRCCSSLIVHCSCKMEEKLSRTENQAQLERKLRELDADPYTSLTGEGVERSDLYGHIDSGGGFGPPLYGEPVSASRQGQPSGSAEERRRLEWEFVEDLENDDRISCKICMGVLVEPHLITCCGECACRSCFYRHWETESVRGDRKRRCPYCRKEVSNFSLILNADLEREINKLIVRCIHSERGCGWSGQLKDGDSHLNNCGFVPINCPNGCGCEKFEKHAISDHLTVCPMEVVKCPFENIGCHSEHRTRKEIQAHSSKDIHHHLILLARSNIAMFRESDESLASLRLHYGRISQEKQQKIDSQKSELANLEQTIESLETELVGMQQKITNLRDIEETSRTRCSTELNDKAEEARQMHELCAVSLAEVQALPVPKAMSFSCPPVTFTVDQFNLRMSSDDQWISPPFYTHYGGYKMCLSVYPNGLMDAKGNHMSVFFHMMCGEFDDHLAWPFPGAIINISAISQKTGFGAMMGGRGNFGADVELMGQVTLDCRSRVFDGSYGPGYGRQKYVPHNVMQDYVVADSFKISVFHIQFIPL